VTDPIRTVWLRSATSSAPPSPMVMTSRVTVYVPGGAVNSKRSFEVVARSTLSAGATRQSIALFGDTLAAENRASVCSGTTVGPVIAGDGAGVCISCGTGTARAVCVPPIAAASAARTAIIRGIGASLKG
jgi:hypothetical protein